MIFSRFSATTLIIIQGFFATQNAYAVPPLPISGAQFSGQLPTATETALGQSKANQAQSDASGAEGKAIRAESIKAYINMNKALAFAKAGKEYADTFKTLANEDKSFDPNSETNGMPKIPLRCATSGECGQCFESAQNRLNNVRTNLEKLRRININAQSFAKRAIALGDSVSGLLPGAGISMFKARQNIEENLKNFERQYSSKYEQLVVSLKGSLEEIGQCEAKYFKEPDWFTRTGFIYYQYMVDRYRL